MIVPSQRLLLASGILPLAGLIGVVGGETGLLVGVAFLLVVLLALVDVLLSTGRQKTLGAELPETVRMARDRPATIVVTIHYGKDHPASVKVGLPFPAGIETEKETQRVKLPDGFEKATFEWSCTARRRGRHLVDGVYLEHGSILGLWDLRMKAESLCELQVHASLGREKHGFANLFLNRGLTGNQLQRQVGKGREFEQLREYLPGDAMEDIHWKATAKRGAPVTKMYRLERTQEIYVVLDASRLSARRLPLGDDDRADGERDTVFERFLTAATVLGLAADRQADLFGVITFADKVRKFVRAGAGRAHQQACQHALYTEFPVEVSPDFTELFTFIRLNVRRRALIIFLSDLRDPVHAEQFSEHVHLVSRKHLCLVTMARPDGIKPLFYGEDPSTTAGVYQRLGGHIQWEQIREVRRVLAKQGVDLQMTEEERLTTEVINRYLSVKQRQLI